MGFAQMVVLDTDFQKKYYNFNFVRREFLGEIRCLVIDVQPKEGQKAARFMGRIWVEDQDYNIVRFNGTYYPQPKINFFFHFDSWRLNMRPGTWLPAYIYSEESDPEDRTEQDSALQGADAALGLRPERSGQERRVHPDSGRFASVGEGSERCRRRRDSGDGRTHVGEAGGRKRR